LPMVIGEPIAAFKEARGRKTGILTEVDSYDWIAFLPMADGAGAQPLLWPTKYGQDKDPGSNGKEG
jgi:hypothetical protein